MAGSTGMTRHARAHQLAAAQAGMLARRQLLIAGWTGSMIQDQFEAGRWQHVHPGVYATFTGPAQPAARLWAAYLYAGPASKLRGMSALCGWGLVEFRLPIELWVPPEQRLAKRLGVTFTRDGLDRPVRRLAGVPPATSIEVSAIDAAAAARSDDALAAVITLVCQRGHTSPERIELALRQLSRVRHRRRIHQVLREVRGGAHSVLEVRAVRNVLRPHGLPLGIGQARESGAGGHPVYRDRVLPHGLVLEFDGRRGHADPSARLRDRRRDNAVIVSGRHTLRYGWHDVVHEPCETAAEIATVLRLLGWTGQARKCPRCRDQIA